MVKKLKNVQFFKNRVTVFNILKILIFGNVSIFILNALVKKDFIYLLTLYIIANESRKT